MPHRLRCALFDDQRYYLHQRLRHPVLKLTGVMAMYGAVMALYGAKCLLVG